MTVAAYYDCEYPSCLMGNLTDHQMVDKYYAFSMVSTG